MCNKEAHNRLELAIKEHSRRVQNLAYLYLKNRYDAEDITQEVFLIYFQKAPPFPSLQQEKAWLLKVTANRCRSLLRAAYRKEVPLPDDLQYLPQDEKELLYALLELEEKYRIPIHLYYYEGYSIKEIARMFHVRAGTVGSWLSRGREMLKFALKEDYLE